MNPSERRSADNSGTSSSMNSRTPTASRPQSFFPSPPRKRLSAGRMRGFDGARSFWWAIRSRPSIASAEPTSRPTTRRARSIAAQDGGAVVEITANFRSQAKIIDHVNQCFEPVLRAEGQPGYVRLTATIERAEHELPCAAKVTVALPRDPDADTQRDEEAAIVARICRSLIGAIEVKRTDGSVTPLRAGDIGLLAPTGTDLWRFERALEAEGLAVASQAGKTLFLQQETQDVLALLRVLADARDTLAFGAFMRGPMVGLTDEELLDVAEQIHQASSEEPLPSFNVRTPAELVSHPVARSVLAVLQDLRRRAASTTPRILLSEAIERLQLRVVLAARHGNRGARALANLDALIEMARPYNVSGLRAFVRNLQSDWEARTQRSEGRIDASDEAVEIVTIHSSKGLEWPVVIPINTSTQFPPPPQFVHRRSDDTLHWVLGGVMPPELAAAREEEKREETARTSAHVVRGLHPGPRPAGHSPSARSLVAILVEDPGPRARLAARTRSHGALRASPIAGGCHRQHANQRAVCRGSSTNFRSSSALGVAAAKPPTTGIARRYWSPPHAASTTPLNSCSRSEADGCAAWCCTS